MPKKKTPKKINMTPRVILVLEDLSEQKDWARPMDLGGKDASHHSHTLKALIDGGYAERKTRFTEAAARASYVYKITKRGRDWLRRRKG